MYAVTAFKLLLGLMLTPVFAAIGFGIYTAVTRQWSALAGWGVGVIGMIILWSACAWCNRLR